jgi:hypothetical protein
MLRVEVLARDGGRRWVVKQEGSDFVVSEHDTPEAAVDAARAYARDHGVEDVVVDDGDGRIDGADEVRQPE